VIGFLGPLQKTPMGAFSAVKHLSFGSEVHTLARPRAITLSTQNLAYMSAPGGWMQVVQAMHKAIQRPEDHRNPLKPLYSYFPMCR